MFGELYVFPIQYTQNTLFKTSNFIIIHFKHLSNNNNFNFPPYIYIFSYQTFSIQEKISKFTEKQIALLEALEQDVFKSESTEVKP